MQTDAGGEQSGACRGDGEPVRRARRDGRGDGERFDAAERRRRALRTR